MNRGLTNISDNLFICVIKLTDKCLSLFSGENVNKMGSRLFNKCQNEIISSLHLYEEFVKICCTAKDQDNQLSDSERDLDELVLYKTFKKIYQHIIKYYLLVEVNQFRKDVLESYQVRRIMVHRKQIRVASTGKRMTLEKQISSTKSGKSKFKKTAQTTPHA